MYDGWTAEEFIPDCTSEDEYANLTEYDWVMYEWGTIAYDYRVHPDAQSQIEILFKRLWNAKDHPYKKCQE